jgi:CheY-like chemotaxis protein
VTNPAKRVLIADDDAAIRRLLQLALAERFEISLAEDGIQALDLLRNSAPFACVVLDVTMPYKGGLEVLREMRSDSALAEIPVVVLTAHEPAHVGNELTDAGLVLYVNKPFDRKILRQLVCELTGVEGTAAASPPVDRVT